jgi:hypothetical protein
VIENIEPHRHERARAQAHDGKVRAGAFASNDVGCSALARCSGFRIVLDESEVLQELDEPLLASSVQEIVT